MNRDEVVRVKLATTINDNLQALADEYGMPKASLAAFAVSKFVREHAVQAQAQLMMAQSLAGSISNLLSDPVALQAFANSPSSADAAHAFEEQLSLTLPDE